MYQDNCILCHLSRPSCMNLINDIIRNYSYILMRSTKKDILHGIKRVLKVLKF